MRIAAWPTRTGLFLGLLLAGLATGQPGRGQAAPDPAPAAAGPAPQAAPAEAARPAQQRRRRARIVRPARPRAQQPEPVPPATLAVPTTPQPELAPMPNRSLEAPIARNDNDGRPTFSPSLIQPREVPGQGGSTLNQDDLARREDRLFREPAAGGTLRLPFSY
ncbi:hypothetical protein LPC08_17125 [Roseomonas sp. OT10]|uniref:hypothetical protein n=1 Tax=Roseomonas cutis TaxID=2897332 RepID=UPI001E3DEEA3|nr:hypothetical protein [Roseomonas sp. OT10]UFN47726.1 hypothetical protein LPC08_17125 [Roseomonas sp. OT10]